MYADVKSLNGAYIMDDSHSWVEFSLSHFLTTAKGSIALDTTSESSLNLTGDLATCTTDLILNATYHQHDEYR